MIECSEFPCSGIESRDISEFTNIVGYKMTDGFRNVKSFFIFSVIFLLIFSSEILR